MFSELLGPASDNHRCRTCSNGEQTTPKTLDRSKYTLNPQHQHHLASGILVRVSLGVLLLYQFLYFDIAGACCLRDESRVDLVSFRDGVEILVPIRIAFHTDNEGNRHIPRISHFSRSPNRRRASTPLSHFPRYNSQNIETNLDVVV
jgi:hypothetical protein